MWEWNKGFALSVARETTLLGVSIVNYTLKGTVLLVKIIEVSDIVCSQ